MRRDRRASAFLRWLAGLDGRDQSPVVLQRPVSGVVDEAGRIFVTDASRQAVFVFDEKAGRLRCGTAPRACANFVVAGRRRAGPRTASCSWPMPSSASWCGWRATATPRRRDRRAASCSGPPAWRATPRRGRLYVADTQAHDIKVFDDARRAAAA